MMATAAAKTCVGDRSELCSQAEQLGGGLGPLMGMAKGRETGSICSRRDWTRGLRKSSVASEQAKSTDPAEWAAGSARLSFV